MNENFKAEKSLHRGIAAKGASSGWPRLISNADLRLEHVPDSGAYIDDIFFFALSYEGYAEAGPEGNCAEVANARRDATLHDLRTCLFFEQRRWRHFGESPTGPDLRYIRGIVKKVRAKLEWSARDGDRGHRFDPEVYKRAIDFAARIHGDQKVPGSGHPYVVHVAKVTAEVIAATEGSTKFDRNLALACAALHDTVEDSEPPDRPRVISELHRDFGKAVADGVLALTKNDELPKPERMPDSMARIGLQRREVWLVKLADRITNLEPPPPHWDLPKRQRYLEEARDILKKLGSASPELRARFKTKLVEYETYCRPEPEGKGRSR